MGSRVLDTATAVALDQLSAALDAVADAGVDPVDARDAVTLVREVEVIARRVRSVQMDLVDRIDRRGLHRADGHASAKVMVRHNARLSPAEAERRARAARARRDLPTVAADFAAGKIGSCHLDRIARAYGNGRVRDELCAQDAALAANAARAASYRAFDAMLTDWVRLTDADGTCDTAERTHANRDAKLVQNLDGSWDLTARCGSLQGAEMHEIFRHFIEAEFKGDWADARAAHGETATAEDLARTDGQRRLDALLQIHRNAASAAADGDGGSQIVTNIVIDHRTFEDIARGLAGVTPRSPVDAPFGFAPEPADADTDAETLDDLPDDAPATGTTPPGGDDAGDDGAGVGFRCSTLDGHPIDPTEVVANALVGHVRRVVVGADSVVIDLGRRRRCFTGPAQLAVRLSSTECFWPGCHVPVTDCQTDHLFPWADHGGGRTHPGNGGPACGRHNRYKQHGFTVRRDDAGRWHTYRPDGTELE